MNIIIRKFSEYGVSEFETLLSKCKEIKRIDEAALDELVRNDSYSYEVDDTEPLTLESIDNKHSIAKKISESLNLSIKPHLYNDRGLWSWLSAQLLDRLVVINKKTGDREFKETALYILETTSWNKYYRHLLAFPCWIYSTLQEKGRIFLRGEIFERGEIVEQLASVHDIQRNPSIVEAATLLYYDSENDGIRKGAASKGLGGTARRFREVIQQFKMTFDLNAMDGRQITELLPNEFYKWKKQWAKRGLI